MSNTNIPEFISNNSVLGASITAALAMVYQMWKILKKDRKEDNLDNAERVFREELRNEIKLIKEENRLLREENNKLHQELAELKAAFNLCKNSTHPANCPFMQHNKGDSNSE